MISAIGGRIAWADEEEDLYRAEYGNPAAPRTLAAEDLTPAPDRITELETETLSGYADIHNHMFAEYAFGGAWLHGNVEGPEASAMQSCTGNADFLLKRKDHANTVIPILNELISKIPGTTGDTGWHHKRRHGYPGYEGWPRWDTIAHQQVYEGFLKKSHENGLTLLVMSAMNSETLCRLMPEKNRKYSCNDMDSVHHQLDIARRFARRNSAWVEIALDPYHAEKIIRSGKLAMILAVETSDLLATGDWRKGLESLYRKGVRSLQPVHMLNNRFAGTATYRFIFNLLQAFRSLENGGWPKGFDTDPKGYNKKGLTSDGFALIEELARRRMLIDLAHLSERSVQDVRKILTEKYHNYPVYISHGHIREMMADQTANHEKATSRWIFDYLRESGGIFGMRTGPEPVKTYGKVANDCDGSTKSFAQVIQYADEVLKVPVAFGSDLNGFIQQLRPRFGRDKETCGAAPSKSELRRQQKAQTGRLGNSFDETGFGRMDQIADVLQELKNFGVNTRNLEHSSDHYIRMWKKTYQPEKAAPLLRQIAGE